ncbi:unnamed protein product [Leptidea sinapis]|uniref:Uncharacterized protein n=1 Tax=Leptidea sinapis TaxID=189913 RepID=A0A5E4PMJ6_9NEOP|nr:unnamed protein product [Leptidea sinapis]
MGKRSKAVKHQKISESNNSGDIEEITEKSNSTDEKLKGSKMATTEDEIRKRTKRQRKPDNITEQNNPHSTHKKAKKIIFSENDEPLEVKDASIINKDEGNIVKNKLIVENEEDNIKDEEIDEFCDDIDEEDNKQYESWIQLLEQKLGADTDVVKKKNKKKKKVKQYIIVLFLINSYIVIKRCKGH